MPKTTGNKNTKTNKANKGTSKSVKRVARKTNRSAMPPQVMESLEENKSYIPQSLNSPISKLANPLVLLGLVIIVLLATLAAKNKGWFVAGMVNGKPITKFELDKKMTERYGSQTLDELINEKLVKDAADKKGLKAGKNDIDAKEQEIRTRLGSNISLEQALTQQNMTLDEFRKQLELQVLVEKLVSDQVKVTDQDINDFLEKNKNSLVATEEAKMKEETKQILTQQKTNEAFSKYFSDLKTQSKILKFL